VANSKRKCRFCDELQRVETMTVINNVAYCNMDHAVACARKMQERQRQTRLEASQRTDKEKANTLKKMKAGLKPKGGFKKPPQDAVNGFVLQRDWGRPCISCGKQMKYGVSSFYIKSGDIAHAGHYRSVASAPHLRFDVRNIHGQCSQCNLYLSGNPSGYRLGLIKLKGIEFVEALEADQRSRNYSKQDFKTIARIFNKRKRLYKKLREGREAGVITRRQNIYRVIAKNATT